MKPDINDSVYNTQIEKFFIIIYLLNSFNDLRKWKTDRKKS